MSTHGATLTSAEAFAKAGAVIDAAAIEDFRKLARENSITIPDGDAAAADLNRLLVPMVAFVKWGNAGVYQVEARIDPAIADAMKRFGQFSGRP